MRDKEQSTKTGEQRAYEIFQNSNYFKKFVESITTKATTYAYAELVQKTKNGAGTEIDLIIRDQTQKTIEKLGKIDNKQLVQQLLK